MKKPKLQSREAQVIRDLAMALNLMVDRFLSEEDKANLDDFEYPLGSHVAGALHKAKAYTENEEG